MARGGSTVRKDLRDLAKPMEVRELNRQLEWIWKQLLGGLNAKSFSTDGLNKITKVMETRIAEAIQAGSIETNVLVAALATMMVAQIGVANIDYAKIVDLFNERLFTDVGVAGQFKANNMVIDKAQIVDLEVGAFRLVSSDGKVYRIDVDENGELTSEYLYDQDDWFEGGQPPEGYSAIASSFSAGEVVAGTLYVTGDASFMKIIAKSLEADEAYINELVSTLIRSELGAGLNLESNSYVNLMVKASDLSTFLRVVSGAVEIGDSSSDYWVQIPTDRVNIMQRGVGAIAYFAYNKMWTRAAEVDDYVKIGSAALEWSSETGLSLVI